MRHDTFDYIHLKYAEIVKNKLTAKSKEYSSESDKFHNFKRAAAMEHCTPEKALRGMMTKHTVSVYDIVDDIEAGNKLWDDAVVQEKITDEIAYLYLLAGLIEERRAGEKVEE